MVLPLGMNDGARRGRSMWRFARRDGNEVRCFQQCCSRAWQEKGAVASAVPTSPQAPERASYVDTWRCLDAAAGQEDPQPSSVSSVSMASGICPVADSRTARWWPTELPGGGRVFCRSSVGQWRHPLAGGGLGEADAVAGGHDDVGVVQ